MNPGKTGSYSVFWDHFGHYEHRLYVEFYKMYVNLYRSFKLRYRLHDKIHLLEMSDWLGGGGSNLQPGWCHKLVIFPNNQYM